MAFRSKCGSAVFKASAEHLVGKLQMQLHESDGSQNMQFSLQLQDSQQCGLTGILSSRKLLLPTAAEPVTTDKSKEIQHTCMG